MILILKVIAINNNNKHKKIKTDILNANKMNDKLKAIRKKLFLILIL